MLGEHRGEELLRHGGVLKQGASATLYEFSLIYCDFS